MSAFWTNAAGTWRKAKEVWFNDAGTWRKAKKIYYNQAGTWRLVFQGGIPFLSTLTMGGDSVSVQFRNDGTLHIVESGVDLGPTTGQWLTSSPSTITSAETAAWEVRFTWVSGPHDTAGTTNAGRTTKSGAAYDTWLSLGTTQSINFTGTPGTISGSFGGTLVFDAEIRLAGGGATLASARFTLPIAS
jgi:hypothetical protein